MTYTTTQTGMIFLGALAITPAVALLLTTWQLRPRHGRARSYTT